MVLLSIHRGGRLRELAAPAEQLAAAQECILTNILEKVPTHDAAHGFVPGRSTVSNAMPHVGRAIIVNADLSDFFPSITFPRVLGLFRWLGYSPAAATILALLCTESPRKTVSYAGTLYHVATGPRALPQGACTSPALSNLIARGLDARLAGIGHKLGWTYTRYADDLTLSADVPASSSTAAPASTGHWSAASAPSSIKPRKPASKPRTTNASPISKPGSAACSPMCIWSTRSRPGRCTRRSAR